LLKDNIKTFRMAKGLSQEELAIKVNVVRQTISKWEKGHSVPDAEMLIKLAEIFEVSVSQLLDFQFEVGGQSNAIAALLGRINEQLVLKNRRAKRIWTVIATVIIGFVLLQLLIIGAISLFRMMPQSGTESTNEYTEIIEK